MTSIKRIIILSKIILLVAFGFLLTSATSYGGEVPDISGFMDMESLVTALKLKVEKAQRSIVMIIAYDEAGIESARGSGFFIDVEGRIITNALIMKGAYSAEVFSGANHYEEVDILNRREDLDLVLIQVKATNETPLDVDFESEVKPGESVITIGKSSSIGTTVSEGLISAVNTISETSDLIEIQTTTGIFSSRPSKDGPVMNMDEKVIGITTTVISNPRNHDVIARVYHGEKLNAVSVRSIKHLVTNPDNIEHLHQSRTKVWSRWLIKKAETTAISIFVTLLNIGFTEVVIATFAFILLISLIQWLYIKLNKIKSGK